MNKEIKGDHMMSAGFLPISGEAGCKGAREVLIEKLSGSFKPFDTESPGTPWTRVDSYTLSASYPFSFQHKHYELKLTARFCNGFRQGVWLRVLDHEGTLLVDQTRWSAVSVAEPNLQNATDRDYSDVAYHGIRKLLGDTQTCGIEFDGKRFF